MTEDEMAGWHHNSMGMSLSETDHGYIKKWMGHQLQTAENKAAAGREQRSRAPLSGSGFCYWRA